MQFRLLGSLQVLDGKQPLELGGTRQRALLALLLIHRGRTLSSDRIVEELWGEQPPPTATKTVQVYVSRLRKILGAQALLTQPEGYALASDQAEVDADRFERLLAEGRGTLAAGDPRAAAEKLRLALDLWRGEPLADFAYEDFAQTEIARLHELRLDALEDRIDADLALGRQRELVGELEQLVGAHPNRERFLAQLMTALYRSGRHTDALEAYRRGRDALSGQLGLEPGPELRALEQRILTHDPDLEAPSRPARLALRRPVPRHERAILLAGVTLLLAAAIALVIALSAGGGAHAGAPPNSLVGIEVRDDRVEAVIPVGSDPDAVAFGAGSLWVANSDDKTVSRVDPRTLQTLRTLALSSTPTGITDAGGGVWVATTGSGTSVAAGRIDPQFDTIDAAVHIYNVVPESAAAITGAGSSVWIAPYSGELTQLDASTGRVLHAINPNAAPNSVAAGAGAVWVADSEAGDVDRVDPSGAVRSIAVGRDPDAIAVGGGAVWVADAGDNTVLRIDPETGAAVATIPVGAAPSGLAVGDGSVWVADSGDGTVERVADSSDRVTARIAVGGSPRAVVLADGRAWVAVDAPAVRSSSAARGGTARLDSAYDVSSMDPALADDTLSWQLLYATCAHLVNYPDKSGPAGTQLVPEVAQSLPAVSRDGRTYTFTIRPGFRFSPPSGARVTAQTFKYTLERSLNPRTKSALAGEYRDIVGADAYIAGRARYISGLSVRGDKLTIHLIEPAPDILARLAEPAACAVPLDTPIAPEGVREIPSAGPYRVASYTPGKGIVLTRNPDYRGPRPHALERFEVAVNVPPRRAVSQVERGEADYAIDGEVDARDAPALARRYGAGSPAARAGHQQYFVRAFPTLSFLALNSHRPLFSDVRLRRAVNFAINRAALARVGEPETELPGTPIDHYLTPGIPGYRNVHAYPSTPELARARRLAAAHTGATAVLYACDLTPCEEKAQIITTDLAAIGLRVRVERFAPATLYTKLATPGEPFDIANVEWIPSYLDPDAILNYFLESGQTIPTLAGDPGAAARLAAAARLSGPARYLTYGRLDLELAADAAPMAAYGFYSSHELFSARMGCEKFGAYDFDIAALCIRRGAR